MIIVSACLADVNCKYDGTSAKNEQVVALVACQKAIPLCPEQLGGLSTPRPQAEIVDGDGADVLNGKARIMTSLGQEVTNNFIQGAREVLIKIARMIGATQAILKSKSPSCGYGKIYNGNFKGKLIPGNGVCASLLKQNGIKIESI